jgi:hypothetical protein
LLLLLVWVWACSSSCDARLDVLPAGSPVLLRLLPPPPPPLPLLLLRPLRLLAALLPLQALLLDQAGFGSAGLLLLLLLLLLRPGKGPGALMLVYKPWPDIEVALSDVSALWLNATTWRPGLLQPLTADVPHGVLPPVLLPSGTAVAVAQDVPHVLLLTAARPAGGLLYWPGDLGSNDSGLPTNESTAVDSCSPGVSTGADAAKRTRVNDPDGMRMTSMLPVGFEPGTLRSGPSNELATDAPFRRSSLDAKRCKPPAKPTHPSAAAAAPARLACPPYASKLPPKVAAGALAACGAYPRLCAAGSGPEPAGLSIDCRQLLPLQLKLLLKLL